MTETPLDLSQIKLEDLDLAEFREIVDQVRPILRGKSPPLIGAALADLLATWLASHTTGNEKEDERMQDSMLTLHMDMVRQLVPLERKRILARYAAIRK